MVEEVRISNWKDHLKQADDSTFIFRRPVTDPRIGTTYHYMGGEEMKEERTCTVDSVRGDCIESSSKEYIKTSRLYEKITLRFDFKPLGEDDDTPEKRAANMLARIGEDDDTPEKRAANMLARIIASVPQTETQITATEREVQKVIDDWKDEISGGTALVGGACNSFVEYLAQLVDLVLGTWTQKITKTVSALLTFGLPLQIVFGVHLIPLIGRLSGSIAEKVTTYEYFPTVKTTLEKICFTVLIAATIVALLVWYSEHSNGMTFQEIVRQETWWNWVTYPIRSSRGTTTCRNHLCPEGQQTKPETICEDGTCTDDACCEEKKKEESMYQKVKNSVSNLDWISAFMKGIGSVATGYLFYTALVKSLPDLVRAFFIFVDGATSLRYDQYAKIVAATAVGGFAAYKFGTWIQEVNMTARLLDDQVNRSFRDKWCYPLRRFRTWKKPQPDIHTDSLIKAIVKELVDDDDDHYRIFEYKEGDQTFHMIALATTDDEPSTDVYCIDQYNAYFDVAKGEFISAYTKGDVEKWFSYTLDESQANYYNIQISLTHVSILYKKISVSSHDDDSTREMTCIFDSHARYEKDIKTFEEITIPKLKQTCTAFILPPCITCIKAAQKIIYKGDNLPPEITINISLGTSLTIEGLIDRNLQGEYKIRNGDCKPLQVGDTDKWSITIDGDSLTQGRHEITIMNTRSTAEEKACNSSSDDLSEKEEEPVPYTTRVVVYVHNDSTTNVTAPPRKEWKHFKNPPGPDPQARPPVTDADYTRYKRALEILNRVDDDIMTNNDLAMLKVHAWLIANIDRFDKEDALYTFLHAKKKGKSSQLAGADAADRIEIEQGDTPEQMNYSYINQLSVGGVLFLAVLVWAGIQVYPTSGAARDLRVRNIHIPGNDFCVADTDNTVPTCRDVNATLSPTDPVRLLNRNTAEVHVLPNLTNSQLSVQNPDTFDGEKIIRKHTEAKPPSTAQTSLEVEIWMEENGFTFSHLSEYGIFPPGRHPGMLSDPYTYVLNWWQQRDIYHEKWMELVREMLQNKRENNNQNGFFSSEPELTKDIFVGSQRAPITLEQLETMLDPKTIEATLVEMFPEKLGPLLNRRMKPEYDGQRYLIISSTEMKLLTGAPFKTIASHVVSSANDDIKLVDRLNQGDTHVNLQTFIDEYTEEIPDPEVPGPDIPDAATGWFNNRGQWRPY